MQVTAPDFFAPFGGKSSAREDEQPGDGLFDALLREEEARYTNEPLPPREPRDAVRPAREDLRADEPRRDEIRPEEPREEARSDEAARPDAPAERPQGTSEEPADDAVAEARPDGDARRPNDDGTAPAEAGKVQSTAVPQTETGGQGAKTAFGAPAPTAGKGAVTAVLPTGQTEQTTATGGTSGVPAQPETTAAPTATGAAQAAGPRPASEGATATPETTAQPASGAAAAQRAGDKASPTATTKDPNPVATAQRQAPGVAPANAGDQPATDTRLDGKPAPQPGVVVTTTAAIESRPTATLGGGAATAALAQGNEGQAKTAPSGSQTASAEALTGEPAKAGTKLAAQSAQAAKTPDALAAARDGKAAAAGQVPAPTAGESAIQSSAQINAPTVPSAAVHNGGGTPLQHTSFSEALASARNTAAANPAEQIAVQVQRAQVDGQDRISIKLHPAELGRIDVKLESSHDGTLRAVVSAERSETLDLLQRDARGLERALQDAGVKTDSGSLSFNLRGQNPGQDPGQNWGQQADGSGLPDGRTAGTESPEVLGAQPQPYRSSHSGALDIRV